MREKGSILALQLHPVIYISLKKPVRTFKKDSGVDLETQMLLNNLIVATISVKISHNTLTYNSEKSVFSFAYFVRTNSTIPQENKQLLGECLTRGLIIKS